MKRRHKWRFIKGSYVLWIFDKFKINPKSVFFKKYNSSFWQQKLDKIFKILSFY